MYFARFEFITVVFTTVGNSIILPVILAECERGLLHERRI
jgi:hypothetical protein